MKKFVTTVILMFFFGSSAYALGTPSFSINEGDNQKGTLSMQELYIGGVRTHENVKIEFDFENSTFRLLELVEADNRISSQAIETFEVSGLNVGLRGCISENRSVTCHLILTSNEFDRRIRLCGQSSRCSNGESTAFDNNGNQYLPIGVTVANSDEESLVSQELVADVQTEATIKFDNLSTRAVEFSLLDLSFLVGDEDLQRVKFRNVNF